MNPRSIELGMVYGVPIMVASSFEDKEGTLIHEVKKMSGNVGEIRNRVSGIATEKGVVKITLCGVEDKPGIAASLFAPLAEADISVDVIVQNASDLGKTDLTFTVKNADLDRSLIKVEEVAKEIGSDRIDTTVGLAKVSIVGTGMQDSPGYASKMFSALADAGVNIEMITTSEIRITCIIDANHLSEAARVLHDVFEMVKAD